MNKLVIKTIKKMPVHLIFWFVVWFFFSSFFSVGSTNKNFIFWFSTILSSISIISSYVFVYQLIPELLIKKKNKKFIVYFFYALVFIVCAVLMTVVFGFIFFYDLEFKKMPELTKNPWVIMVCVLMIIAFTSSFKILKHNFRALEEKKTLENKFLQTQLQLKEQELKFLKMQIHPHFLFNTLNTIYGFALKNSDKTPELILKMSNLLDYILYQIDKPKVFLKDEVNHIQDYISLEKTRFQDSLHVVFDKEIENETIEIAPMILLPFIENAFKHGAQINEVLDIKIYLKVDEESLVFKIENSAIIKQNSKNGIGLENLEKRLEMLYRNQFSLKINQEEELFKINLKIQF